MLPPARGRWPLGQDHRARLVDSGRRGVLKRERELAEHERQVRLRRLHAEQLAQGVAGGHRVGDPGRHPHLVLDHTEAPVGRAHHVESRERDPARRRGPAHRGLVVGRGLHLFAREHAGLEHAAVAVHVGHERLQRAQALHDAGLELRPLRLREDARHRVEREDAVGRGPKAHATGAQAALDLGGGGGGITERREQLRVVRARLPIVLVRLVVGARRVLGRAHTEPRTRSPLGSNSGSLVISPLTQLPKMSSSTAVPGSDPSGGR